jgi:hypothetical protein
VPLAMASLANPQDLFRGVKIYYSLFFIIGVKLIAPLKKNGF